MDDERARELAELKAEYQKYPPVPATLEDGWIGIASLGMTKYLG